MKKGMVEAAGFIFMIGLTIVISMMLFFLVTYDQNPDSENIERTIDYRVGEIEARSTMQTTMEGNLWRETSTFRGKYNNLGAYKILTYWFSTPEGDDLHINNRSIGYQEARNDLRNYLKNRMTSIFVEDRAERRYYNLSILYDGGKYNNKLIMVTPNGVSRDENALMTSFEYPIALRGSERAKVSISIENVRDTT